MDSVYSVYNLPNKVLHHLTASIEENVGIYNIIEDSMDIIQDRDKTHAPSDKFKQLAETAQTLKTIVRSGLVETDKFLDEDMMESIDLICTKIARIVHGDSKHIDHWLDIAGYSQLIVNRLQSDLPPPTQKPSKQRK
jgi:hypothetical protein